MKLAIITSTLIVLGAAVPAFQERRTYPAGLRSPLHVIKRGETTDETPAVAARFVSQGGGGFRGRNGKREETEVEDPVLAARFVSQGGGGFRGRNGKREETEVEDSVLEARFVSQGGGGFRGRNGKREETEVEDSVLEARFVSQGGGGFRGRNGKREETEVEDPVLAARFVNHNAQQQHRQPQQQNFNGFPGGRGNQLFNTNPGNQGNPFLNNNLNGNGSPFGVANVRINNQQHEQISIGEPKRINVNGPINNMSTDRGSCVPFIVDNGVPIPVIRGAFGVNNPFNDAGLFNNQGNQVILLWCGPTSQTADLFRGL